MGVDLIGLLIDTCEIVSETEHFVNPAIQIMSPALTSLTGTLLFPSKVNNFVNLPFSKISPWRFIAFTESFTFAVPLSTFPVKHLPKKGSESKRVVSIVKGSFIFEYGSGTDSMIKSSNGDRFFLSSFISLTHQPSLPEAYKIGKSSCSSVASKDKNKSNTSSNTSFALLSFLSILLIITIGFRPWERALPKTNLVCGIGPSEASVSNITPSAIQRTRSTSPPKSAWPGVSIILIFVCFQIIDVGLAKIVIPLSFSRSPLSSSLSSIFSLVLNIPLCLKIESIKVVLPWSTWAIMAIFLICEYIYYSKKTLSGDSINSMKL